MITVLSLLFSTTFVFAVEKILAHFWNKCKNGRKEKKNFKKENHSRKSG